LKKPFPYQSQNIKISDMKYWNYLKDMKKKKEKKEKRKMEKKNPNKIIFIYLKFWNIHN
jgi:serine kinase of HPr protein (carbohydrate metabolism regulator)